MPNDSGVNAPEKDFVTSASIKERIKSGENNIKQVGNVKMDRVDLRGQP